MTEQLDLLLVNPGARFQVYGTLGSSLSGIEPPLWCALLAAFIRTRGYSVRILDAEVEGWNPEQTAKRISEHDPTLAAIIVLGSNPSASSTPKMTATSQLLHALGKEASHVKTLLGGLHPSALPERTLREEPVDFVCQGEGFHTIEGILESMKSGRDPCDVQIPGLWYRRDGRTISSPPAPLVNPDDLPMAAWDLLPMERYRAHNWHCFDHIDQRQPYAVMYTSLGCPFNCSYCNIHALYNDQRGIRFRSPELIVEEIDFLSKHYGMRNIKFMDELFAAQEDRVIRLCDLIIERGFDLNIWAYARIDTVSKKMLSKMKSAGIRWVAYGFESASEKVRKGVAKKTREDETSYAIGMTQESGIYIMGNFIFGLPDDDLITMRETLDKAKELNFEYVNFYSAMAYPGSRLYNEALAAGIKLPESWHGYGQFSEDALPLPTKHITAMEVLRFRDDAFREYFGSSRYQKMVQEKFGLPVVEHIKDMLSHEMKRTYR